MPGPLSSGQKLALYLLMGQQAARPDGESSFRQSVEANGHAGDYQTAFIAAIKQQLDPNFDQDAQIGAMPDLDPDTIRTALGFAPVYCVGCGPCPNVADGQVVYTGLK